MLTRASMPGIRELATAAGVSIATASRALRDDPVVRFATRMAVKEKAREIGYEANPYTGRFMSSLRRREVKTLKGNLAILWAGPSLKTDERRASIREGVFARAGELGYAMDEFELGCHSARVLRNILVHRGVRGVLIGAPSFLPAKAYLRMDLADFACVVLGWGLIYPRLNSIRFDYFQAMRLAIHHARHAFGEGIAGLWDLKTDRRAHQIARSSFLTHHPAGPAIASELFWHPGEVTEKSATLLIRQHGVRCLIVEPGVVLPPWLRDSLPAKSLVLFKNPGNSPCFGWLDTQNSLMGRWGVDALAANLHLNRQGVPDQQQVILVPPRWMPGG